MSDHKIKQDLNRRNFMKVSAAAGAGLMMPNIIRSQTKVGDSNDLNIALLGTGAEGQVLLNAMLKLPNLRFRAVCDIWTDYNQKRAARLLKKYGHPAVFPESLVLRLLKLFSYKDDVVLDPFNGVGTTTLVAFKIKRRYIGIDISKKYCKIAEERIEKLHPTLF